MLDPFLIEIISHSNNILLNFQNWEADDYRNARFIVAPKQTNEKWAINLIKETPPVPVKGRIAVCEGGPSEALGHPKIYINLVCLFKICIYYANLK